MKTTITALALAAFTAAPAFAASDRATSYMPESSIAIPFDGVADNRATVPDVAAKPAQRLSDNRSIPVSNES